MCPKVLVFHCLELPHLYLCLILKQVALPLTNMVRSKSWHSLLNNWILMLRIKFILSIVILSSYQTWDSPGKERWRFSTLDKFVPYRQTDGHCYSLGSWRSQQKWSLKELIKQKPALVAVMGNLLGEHRETTTYLVTHTPHSAGCLHLKPLDLITIGEVSQILCQGYKVKKKLHFFLSNPVRGT